MQLTFNTLEKATEANLQIFENYARTFGHVLRTSTDELVEVSNIPKGELVAMVYLIPGYKQGNPQIEGDGGTSKWADVKERADESGVFFFQKPDDSLMTDVVFDSEEEIGEGWTENEAE